MDNLKQNNFAFIDGQNLYLGTTKCYYCADKLGIEIKDCQLSDCTCGKAWEINLKKLRIYLDENYSVTEAYYFLGYLNENNTEIYNKIQKAGFIIIFKEHSSLAKSKKKGNVDTDIVFEIMKNLIERYGDINKIVLISGDGDYKKIVYYLVGKGKFKKILFPNRKYSSSLYKELGSEYYDYLDNIRSYIE